MKVMKSGDIPNVFRRLSFLNMAARVVSEPGRAISGMMKENKTRLTSPKRKENLFQLKR